MSLGRGPPSVRSWGSDLSTFRVEVLDLESFLGIVGGEAVAKFGDVVGDEAGVSFLTRFGRIDVGLRRRVKSANNSNVRGRASAQDIRACQGTPGGRCAGRSLRLFDRKIGKRAA